MRRETAPAAARSAGLRRSRESSTASGRRPSARARPRPACRRCSAPCGAGSRRPSTANDQRQVESAAVRRRRARTDRALGRRRPACRSPGTPAKSCRPTSSAAARRASPRASSGCGHVPDVAVQERRHERRVDDPVLVGLARRRRSARGSRPASPRPPRPARRGQHGVQRPRRASAVERVVERDARHLRRARARRRRSGRRRGRVTGVPSIGASASSSSPWIETPFGLALPADVVGAVVLERQSCSVRIARATCDVPCTCRVRRGSVRTCVARRRVATLHVARAHVARDPGLTTGDPRGAQRARVGLIGRHLQLDQRLQRQVEPRRIGAAIDDRRGADDLGAVPPRRRRRSRASSRRS